MPDKLTLEQLEQQVSQLHPHEQLKLIAHISERLSLTTQEALGPRNGDSLRQRRQKEADRLVAICNEAAEKWQGRFDAAEDIRRMREERDARFG